MKGLPPREAALAEARRLRQSRKVDVVVVLAAVPYQEAVTLAILAEDAADFVVQSHDAKGIGIGERVGSHAAVFPAGELGRQIARLELSVDGPGPVQRLVRHLEELGCQVHVSLVTPHRIFFPATLRLFKYKLI